MPFASAERPLLLFLLGGLSLAASCGDDDGPPPAFPADYLQTYEEVRECRASTEHDFANVRVLADPAALEPYQGRERPFPVGAVVLKEEYDIGDVDCAGDIVRWTVMTRRETGSAPDMLDWSWQSVGADRRVRTQDEPRCAGCHETCGEPPDGYEGTCEVP